MMKINYFDAVRITKEDFENIITRLGGEVYMIPGHFGNRSDTRACFKIAGIKVEIHARGLFHRNGGWYYARHQDVWTHVRVQYHDIHMIGVGSQSLNRFALVTNYLFNEFSLVM